MPEAQHTSPLTVFVNTLKLIAAQRATLMPAINVDDWRTFLEDVTMMLDENVVIGLRTRWVRRVAVPVHRAWLELRQGEGKPKDRALKALEIMNQCEDKKLRDECIFYIRNRHDIGADE